MFNHEAAQNYEIESAKNDMLKDFSEVYEKWEKAKQNKSLWQDHNNQWFNGDLELWNKFLERANNGKCLEVGSGPFGFLAPCYWIKDRVIIDPLVEEYKSFQISNFGRTFFTEDITTYGQNAEEIVDDLVGNVDGFVVCRNALDHCAQPMIVLKNIAKYASTGCYFLLWTDIWHNNGLDDGHSNITTSTEELDRFMIENGFMIVKYGSKIRNPEEYIEYGRVFIKV